MSEPFWRTTPLESMSKPEWESLCDGCGRCCLVKLQDEVSLEVEYTRVVCRYFDEATCQCSDYQNRNKLVPTCVWLTPEMLREYDWLPTTCAYRLLAEGEDLPEWHPLVSGRAETVAEAGIAVRGRIISEDFVHSDGLDEHVVRWVHA